MTSPLAQWRARSGRVFFAALATLFVVPVFTEGCATKRERTLPALVQNSASTGGTAGAGEGGEGGAPVEHPCGIDCATIGVDACHVATCNLATKQCEVVNAKAGTPCDDQLFCTLSDSCQDGACVGGPATECGMTAPDCYDIVCTEMTQSCATVLEPDGATCADPNDLCLTGGKCKNGLCTGYPNDCFFAPVPDDCHIAVCNPKTGKCEPEPGNDTLSCSVLGDLCSNGNICNAGLCVGGAPKNCQSLSVGCNVGECDGATGQCKGVPVMLGSKCDDVNHCTAGETCQAGNVCGGGTKTSACKNGDGCCPVGCTGLTDDDCSMVLSLGRHTSCVGRSNGQLLCFGNNQYGQLGNGSTNHSNVPVPATVAGVVTVAVGRAATTHTCAGLADGTAKCWGNNGSGQLGNGTQTSFLLPVPVTNLTGVVGVAAGLSYSCAHLTAGNVKCWGGNAYGQLGTGNTTAQTVPVDTLPSITNVVSLALGDGHSCALLTDKTMKCWGRNNYGQIGIGNTTTQLMPVAVPGVANVKAIAAGQYHTCALLEDTTALCWGYNVSGQLGNGTTLVQHSPVSVSGLTGAVAIAAGDFHSCAVLATGTATCWGQNSYGKLGDGAAVNKNIPVPVLNLTEATSIKAGADHTCAVWEGGVKCWGYNVNGQLGNATTTNASTPVTTLL
ncbi:MAG: hypothetical protein EXR75_13110 [Myxococcales bacterium]|nr:hypothetical protein [Myxococcales bacterium]